MFSWGGLWPLEKRLYILPAFQMLTGKLLSVNGDSDIVFLVSGIFGSGRFLTSLVAVAHCAEISIFLAPQ